MNATTPLRVASRTLGTRRPGTILSKDEVQKFADAGRLDDLLARGVLVPSNTPAVDVEIIKVTKRKPRKAKTHPLDSYREVGKPGDKDVDLVTDESELIPLEDVDFDESDES